VFCFASCGYAAKFCTGRPIEEDIQRDLPLLLEGPCGPTQLPSSVLGGSILSPVHPSSFLNYIPHLDYPSQLPCASTVCYHGNLRAVSARTRSSRTWESKTSSTQVHCKWHSSRRLHGVSALHVTHGQRCAAFEHVLSPSFYYYTKLQ
jgi:hypothetical protein